jgi:RNA polymerase sigma-70 factor (ECF subfamily)
MNAAATSTPGPTDDTDDEGPHPDAHAWLSADGLTGEKALPPDADPDDPLWQAAADVPLAGPGLTVAVTERQLAIWIEAVVDQDERALAALYDATFSRVFGLVQRIVRNAAMAEEVVEDAYFQVWRQAVRFDPARGKALTWVLAIARSRAIDALRSEARFRHEPLDDEPQQGAADPAAPADELLDLARHRSDLHQALMLLGAQPRQLVSLAFFRGLSHEEIAQQTRLPLGTVKSQIRRALLLLREILGERGLQALAS